MNHCLKTFYFVIIVFISVFSTGCDDKEAAISSPFGPKKIEKVKISFDQKINAEIKIPEGAKDSVSADTGPVAAGFEIPVSAEGKVISLALGEMPVELKETALINGTLHTRDYGYIDVLLVGLRENKPILELRATPEQILSLKRQIVKYRNNKRDLFSAVIENDIPKLNALIETGADLNVRTVDDITPLTAATIMNRKEIVHILLDANVEINARDSIGWTALIHCASAYGDPGMFDELIKAHADINARDIHGTTALIVASMKGNIDLVKTLVDAGADLNAEADTNGGHFTALNAAESRGNKEIADFLKKSGATPD